MSQHESKCQRCRKEIDTSVTCPHCGYGAEPAYMMEQPRVFTKSEFVRLEAEVAELQARIEFLDKALNQAVGAGELRIHEVLDTDDFYKANRYRGETLILGTAATEQFIASGKHDKELYAYLKDKENQNV
jgi:hypothetical protein